MPHQKEERYLGKPHRKRQPHYFFLPASFPHFVGLPGQQRSHLLSMNTIHTILFQLRPKSILLLPKNVMLGETPSLGENMRQQLYPPLHLVCAYHIGEACNIPINHQHLLFVIQSVKNPEHRPTPAISQSGLPQCSLRIEHVFSSDLLRPEDLTLILLFSF
ncbi:hypothetical protein SDC9_132211 [bioreactor metagenome]|uniref:Uncharacterized protein n=1 Tax=bioreactor metagenome TaxID=1076179 RepID=A0A645D709_9ZZZZ